MKQAQEADFYTEIYREVAAGKTPEAEESASWIMERYEAIAPLVVGYSVLDLGCGIAYIADMIGEERQHLGVDFSDYAIRYSRWTVRNPKARFRRLDLREMGPGNFRTYDTVLLLEILEHVAEPNHLASLALALARRRIVATVPRDMPGTAHVWPTWQPWMVRGLFGEVDRCELFGKGDKWWLIVKEME